MARASDVPSEPFTQAQSTPWGAGFQSLARILDSGPTPGATDLIPFEVLCLCTDMIVVSLEIEDVISPPH